MPERWKDWLTQAKRDLNHAENACRDGDFEWSCFSTQQSAEKAVKAVFLYLHGEGWGHSVFGLLRNLSNKTEVPETILEAAKILDKLTYLHDTQMVLTVVSLEIIIHKKKRKKL
jgi:HEPN domain-containing protein